MTLRTFLIIAFISVVSVLVAMTGLHRPPETGEKILFPGISERINDIASLTIRSATGSITVKRSSQGWHLEEWDRYPADVSKIRAMIAEMIRAVLLEPKTTDVRRHALLDLADPDGAAELPADGRGRALTLHDANGNVLTAIIIGRRRFDLGGASAGGGEGIYVRRPGETQTWLARTSLFPTTDLHDWVEPTVIELDSARLAQVTLSHCHPRHPHGHSMRVTQKGTPPTVTVDPILPHTKPDAKAIHRMLTLLSHITFENVRKSHVGIEKENEDADARAVMTTHDGLQINVRAYNRGGATWLALTAHAARESTTTVNTEAETLQRRHSQWLYKIPAPIAAALHTRLENLMQKPEQQEGEEQVF